MSMVVKETKRLVRELKRKEVEISMKAEIFLVKGATGLDYGDGDRDGCCNTAHAETIASGDKSESRVSISTNCILFSRDDDGRACGSILDPLYTKF